MTGKQVQLPWGKATVEEEATIAASASERAAGARRRAPQRRRRRAAAALLLPRRRAAPSRGPLTLRPAEVAALALELRKQPALRKLVAGLGK